MLSVQVKESQRSYLYCSYIATGFIHKAKMFTQFYHLLPSWLASCMHVALCIVLCVAGTAEDKVRMFIIYYFMTVDMS